MPLDPLVANGRVTFETTPQHASTRVPVFSPTRRMEDVLSGLVVQRYESASHLVVCEDGRFLGLVRIEVLLSAPADALLGDMMDREAPVVAPDIDQEVAALPKN